MIYVCLKIMKLPLDAKLFNLSTIITKEELHIISEG